MGDFIKDLNIIDFLGMLLPGSLYVMASRELLPVDKLLKYFGDEPGAAAQVTFLLVGGYVIGILFHEVGDWLEKLLWHFRFLNPRTYAAKKTGLHSLLVKGKGMTEANAWKEIIEGDRIYYSIDGKTDVRRRNLFEGFRTMARNLLLVLILIAIYPGVLAEAGRIQRGFYIAACVVLFLRYYHYSYLKFKYSYEDYLNAIPANPGT